MFRGLVVVSFLCCVAVGAKPAACTAEQGRIKQLESKILELEKELGQAKSECAESQRISLTKIGSQCASFGNDVVQHVLKSTNLDDQIFDRVSNSAAAARQRATAFTTGIVDKVSSFNYTEHYQALQASNAFQALMKKTEVVQPYVDKAKPILDKAKDMCQPVFEKAEPVLQKAKGICKPMFAKTLETCSVAKVAVEERVLPALRSGGSQAFDSVFGTGLTKLDHFLAPLYEKAGSIAPQHKATLPQHPIDRVLFIVVWVFFAYYGLYLARFCLRLTLKFLGKTTLMSFFVFRIAVMFPLRIVLKVVSCILWVATAFYCCGLCSKKKTPKPKGKQQKGQNGAQNLTVVEAVKVLKQAQQKKNEDKAVKLLSDFVKSGKPMTQKNLEGKLVTKEVLLEACKKLGIKASI